MKKYILSAATLAIFSMVTILPASAQEEDKVKEKSKLAEYEEIIIKKKKDGDAKVVVEIKDGIVSIDGKPIEDYDSDAVSVIRRKPSRVVYGYPRSQFRSGDITVNGRAMRTTANRAFLGIATEATDNGVRIERVTEESSAAKAGLKEGDIIVQIDEKKVSDPDDVTEEIRKHKPEDKITVTYKRNGKENKTTATLGRNSTMIAMSGDAPMFPNPPAPPMLENFQFEGGDHFKSEAPLFKERFFNDNLGSTFSISTRPRLGIRAQDTEENNGAKVLGVGKESLAEKAGIKENDIIVAFDGQTVKGADDLASASRAAREKTSIDIKVNRGGKEQTMQIKIPKRLKTTSL